MIPTALKHLKRRVFIFERLALTTDLAPKLSNSNLVPRAPYTQAIERVSIPARKEGQTAGEIAHTVLRALIEAHKQMKKTSRTLKIIAQVQTSTGETAPSEDLL